jgi:hypothetical protein
LYFTSTHHVRREMWVVLRAADSDSFWEVQSSINDCESFSFDKNFHRGLFYDKNSVITQRAGE